MFEFVGDANPNQTNPAQNSAIAFTRPMFEFVGDAVSRGEHVLVHCLAGLCAYVFVCMCVCQGYQDVYV